MPLHLTRRGFVAGSLAAGGLAFAARAGLAAADEAQVSRFALLADTHIPADKAFAARGVTMADNLAQVWAQVRARKPGFAAAMVHGDVAYLRGEAGDYRSVAELLVPADKLETPLHFLLGNHDDRDAFRTALKDHGDSPLESHHVAIIESPHANWFLLDSLEKVNGTPGLLGDGQLDWLAAALYTHDDKPALVSVHHNPQWPKGTEGEKIGGLKDTAALFERLTPRRHVKAVFFGHTHAWSLTQHEGIHLVNLPPVAYVFKAGMPSGWVEAETRAGGIDLTLHALDPQHPQHRQAHQLAWRK